MRELPIRERTKAQVRGEFFDAFDEVHFLAPDTTAGSGGFRITA